MKRGSWSHHLLMSSNVFVSNLDAQDHRPLSGPFIYVETASRTKKPPTVLVQDPRKSWCHNRPLLVVHTCGSDWIISSAPLVLSYDDFHQQPGARRKKTLAQNLCLNNSSVFNGQEPNHESKTKLPFPLPSLQHSLSQTQPPPKTCQKNFSQSAFTVHLPHPHSIHKSHIHASTFHPYHSRERDGEKRAGRIGYISSQNE